MTKAKKIVKISHDSDSECPSNWGAYTLRSFARKHSSYIDKDTALLEHREAIKHGTAFVCSYFEHSDCCWSLHVDGVARRFDFVPVAGILLVNDESLASDEKSAASFLNSYTQWANGQVYLVEVLDECQSCGHHIDVGGEACGGFYDEDAIVEYLNEKGVELHNCEVIGECDYMIAKKRADAIEIEKLIDFVAPHS